MLGYSVLSFYKIKVDIFVRFGVTGFLFFIYIASSYLIYEMEKQVLITGKNSGHFAVHWLSAILLLITIYNCIKYAIKHLSNTSAAAQFTWVVTLAVVVIFSVEIQHLYVWLSYSKTASIEDAEDIFAKAGLSILWGISSFIIIWAGLKKRYKQLRIIALSLFAVTIAKLFLYDLSNISPGGKIAAFILLGALLLTVSFMYQRLKKIIIDDVPADSKIDKNETTL
jgi:uncharacterized membrane protein